MAEARQVGWWCDECRHVMDLNDITRCDASVPVYVAEPVGVTSPADPTPTDECPNCGTDLRQYDTVWPESTPS